MKMNHDLIKRILLAFEESDVPYTDYKKITAYIGDSTKDINAEVCYHLELLADQGLICGTGGDQSIGISYDLRGEISISIVNLRLTAAGHEYLGAIKKPEVWEKIKKVAGNAGLETMISTAKMIIENIIKTSLKF